VNAANRRPEAVGAVYARPSFARGLPSSTRVVFPDPAQMVGEGNRVDDPFQAITASIESEGKIVLGVLHGRPDRPGRIRETFREFSRLSLSE
jgi:hypothetical protein